MEQTRTDRLMNALLPIAKGSIEKKKEFFPFGAHINAKDEIIMSMPNESEEEQDSAKMISLIEQSLREHIQNKETSAVAICVDVQMTVEGITEKVSAIRLSLEDVDGGSFMIFLPYQISEVGEVTYGDLYGEEKAVEYFV